MTSKEIINEYIKNYKDSLTCMHNPKIMKRQVELINEMELIKKDLEILDIFKSLGFELQTTTLESNLFFSTYLKSALLTEEQYTKLKEWSEKNELDISHRKLTDDELDILYKIYSFKWE